MGIDEDLPRLPMEAIDCGLKPSAKKGKEQGKQILHVTQVYLLLILHLEWTQTF